MNGGRGGNLLPLQLLVELAVERSLNSVSFASIKENAQNLLDDNMLDQDI